MFVLIHLLRSRRKRKKKHGQKCQEKQSTEFHNNLRRKGNNECPNWLLKDQEHRSRIDPIHEITLRNTNNNTKKPDLVRVVSCSFVRVISWIVIHFLGSLLNE